MYQAIGASAATLALAGAVGTAAPATAAHAGIRAAIPACGDSISIQSVKYSGTTFSFKIVGVDLSPWLGKGYGTMGYSAGTDPITPDAFASGEVNASPTAGARTGIIAISPVHTNVSVLIDVSINASNGTTKCIASFQLNPNNYKIVRRTAHTGATARRTTHLVRYVRAAA